MSMYFVWFITISNVLVQVYSAQDDPCTTPYGYKGKCIQLPSCLILLEKINPNNATTTRFAQDSLCGWEGIVPLVCCELNLKESRYSSIDEEVIIALNDFDTK
ncbi:hypothetical protein ILUMI_19943, partial [Ignelater luminosus]